mgnify:CR=1 FL=1
MEKFADKEIWFVTGSQHLYGAETLHQVAEDSQQIVEGLNQKGNLPVEIKFKPTVKTPEEIYDLMIEANTAKNCIGLITWMHTFSPAKMWISGLGVLKKPFLHLHTQFNREIPWNDIDMDFMNLNQSAHGDREFGFICSRLRLNRKVVVGHWQEKKVHNDIAVWMRAAIGWNESQGLKICRFGDNMRDVAVTEGDKVEAQKVFGWQVKYHGVGDLVAAIEKVTDEEVEEIFSGYLQRYTIASTNLENIKYQAKIEAGMKNFLDKYNYKVVTTNFEDLHGLKQLPGLAIQSLMDQGYGFGAEGDWKQAALVHIMKVMAKGLKGGCSFMEDYTYHLLPGQEAVLSAHMLEICPSLAENQPAIEVHPLGIGGKDDPARLVFDVAHGHGSNATIVDMGGRMRMIVNPVNVIKAEPLPKLPVARALWIPEPNLETSAAAWIYAGGAHHTSFSMALDVEHLENFADMAGLEFLVIDKNTNIREFKKELRFNDFYYNRR